MILGFGIALVVLVVAVIWWDRKIANDITPDPKKGGTLGAIFTCALVVTAFIVTICTLISGVPHD